MKENDGDGSKWYTLDELSELLRGHIICPECSTEAGESDLVKVIDDVEYLYRCPGCGCEYTHEDEED